MRIISFDVGMKNLAYCIFTVDDNINSLLSQSTISTFTQESLGILIKSIHLERWDVIDLRFEPVINQVTGDTIVAAAPSPPQPKQLCDNDSKQAKFMYLLPMNKPKLYCVKCSEKSKYKIPSREIMPIKRKPELLQKKKLDEIVDIYNNIVGSTNVIVDCSNAEPKKLRKSDRILEIQTILSRDFLETFDESKYMAAINSNSGVGSVSGGAVPIHKKPNYTYAHDLDLITYGRNLMKHMDVILTGKGCGYTAPIIIDMMIVENQISTLASRMKTLQGMLTQYFIMKNVPQIEFISASCKLKLFTDSSLDISKYVTASSYSDRKKSGISICRSLGIQAHSIGADYASWIPMFEQHKKKDDLADCFLQGLWRVYLLTTNAV
jgi:hypothetical protein